jgi:rSAM/selenodomain-associated transferase 2
VQAARILGRAIQMISIVLPTLNEAQTIPTALRALEPLRGGDVEIVVVDGGSADETVDAAKPMADRVEIAPRGRASQMNVGAKVARGDVLLFLHADTRLPENAMPLIEAALRDQSCHWGRFDVRIEPPRPLLRLVAWSMSLRSRLSGIATGDQAIFVRASVFRDIGGYPDIPLMEDITLSRRLKRHGAPACLRQYVTTSGRRWEKNGILRTILLMWRFRLAYYFGADPARLAERYGNAPRR